MTKADELAILDFLCDDCTDRLFLVRQTVCETVVVLVGVRDYNTKQRRIRCSETADWVQRCLIWGSDI